VACTRREQEGTTFGWGATYIFHFKASTGKTAAALFAFCYPMNDAKRQGLFFSVENREQVSSRLRRDVPGRLYLIVSWRAGSLRCGQGEAFVDAQQCGDAGVLELLTVRSGYYRALVS
jgi:hypothetical protein